MGVIPSLSDRLDTFPVADDCVGGGVDEARCFRLELLMGCSLNTLRLRRTQTLTMDPCSTSRGLCWFRGCYAS